MPCEIFLLVACTLASTSPIVSGSVRGGLGGYSTPSEHASPPSEGECDCFGDFSHL